MVIFGTAGTWPSVFAPHKGSKVLDVRQCLVPRVHKAGLSMMLCTCTRMVKGWCGVVWLAVDVRV